MKRMMNNVATVVLLGVFAAGCGQSSSGVNENKPIQEVQAEAQKMNADQLKAMVQKYETALQSKKAEIETVQAKLKEIPIKDLLGEDAKKIKEDISQIGSSMKNLTERLNVYADSLKTKVN